MWDFRDGTFAGNTPGKSRVIFMAQMRVIGTEGERTENLKCRMVSGLYVWLEAVCAANGLQVGGWQGHGHRGKVSQMTGWRLIQRRSAWNRGDTARGASVFNTDGGAVTLVGLGGLEDKSSLWKPSTDSTPTGGSITWVKKWNLRPLWSYNGKKQKNKLWPPDQIH